MERRVGGHDHPTNETDWRELRLVAGKVYAVGRVVTRGNRSFCAALRRGVNLPGEPAGALVSGVLDGAERPGSTP